MDEKIDIGPELYNLRDRLEKDHDNLSVTTNMNLNTLIYYFEKFLDSHKRYEKTRLEIMVLDGKLKELEREVEGDENEPS